MFKFDPDAKKFFNVFLVLAVFAALPGFVVGYVLTVVFFLMAIFSLFFFRDPGRDFLGDVSMITSPADGEVVVVGRYDDPDYGEMNRIAIFMSIWDVHVNRIPCDGKVERLEYIEGGYKHAGSNAAFEENERMKIYLKTDRGVVQVHQIAGMVARRVVCRLEEGQKLERGDKIGVIRFGSRLEVLIPADETEIIVEKGEKVRCGTTPIAKWV